MGCQKTALPHALIAEALTTNGCPPLLMEEWPTPIGHAKTMARVGTSARWQTNQTILGRIAALREKP